MKANFRQVFVYYVEVVAQAANATLPSMSDLVTVWDRRRQAGQAHAQVSNGDIDLTLGDVVIDPGQQSASLLIRHSDKQAAESVYSDIRNNAFTAHPKGQNEGGETGVHVFLSTAQEQGQANRYVCVIEKVPYLDVALIRRFLNRVLHDEYDNNPAFHTFPNPAGQRTRQGQIRIDRCLPRLEFQGMPSQNLAQDVQNGRLQGITLIRTENRVPVGGVPFLTTKEATLKLEVDQGGLTANVWRDVRRAILTEAPNFPVAQVGFRLPGRNKTVSIKVDSQTGAPLTELYIKSFDVTNIFPPMAHSSQSVVPAFSQRVIPVLLQERTI